MRKLRAAVIGAGNMGRHHVRTYAELPDVELVAVVDMNQATAASLADQYHCRAYTTVDEMIAAERPDVASVAVPTSLHAVLAKQCFAQGLHLLIEKPIGLTVDEGQTIIDLARQHNRVLLVGHIERFNPAIVKVKQLIDAGELGKITSLMARRVGGFPPQIKDANIAVDLSVHDIDIANYLLGELPKSIAVHKQRNHIEQREDAVEFFLQYGRASAYLQANWITPVKIRKLNLTGSDGYLEMDFVNQSIEFYKSNYEKFRETTADYTDFVLRFSDPERVDIVVEKNEPLRQEISAFLQAVRDQRPIDVQYAVDALRIALTP